MKTKFCCVFACVIMLLTCLGLAACLGGSSISGGSNNANNNSGETNDNQVQEDNDGTFIYTGSSIKAANTSISGAIVIPSEHNGTPIDTIPANAFKGCNGITSIEVPVSVTSIGSDAFNGCSILRSITLPFVGSQKGNSGKAANFGYIFGTNSYQGGTQVKQYYSSSSLDYNYYYIPSTLRTVAIRNETILGYGAFQNCSMLTEINLNNGIVQVGVRCFESCTKIEEVELPDITIIPSSLFSGCISLSKFTINSSVDTIGSSAFSGCSALSTINSETAGEFIIPNSVTSVGSSTFNGCSLLRSITLPFVGSQKGNSGKEARFGYIFGTNSYQGGTQVKQYYSSSSLDYDFYYIPSTLRIVTIKNETVIGYGAFQNCSMLTSITINSGAQNQVGNKAFDNTVTPIWEN